MSMYNIDAEQAVISAFMSVIDVPAFLGKYSNLQPHHFYFEEHCKIFKAIQDIDSGSASLFRLIHLVPDQKEYLQKLIGCGTPINIKQNILVIIDFFKRRKMLEICKAMTEEAEDLITPANESILKMNGEFEDLLKKEFDFEFKTSAQISKEAFSQLTEVSEISPTGIQCLDTAMGGGLYRGKAYAIAARKKVGKTVMASTISENLNKQGKKHLFIAAEMSPIEIHHRVMARNMGCNSLNFIGESRNQDKFQSDVKNYKDEGNTIYLKAPGIPFNQLRMAITSAILRYDIEGVILDYFQLVGGQGKEGLVNHYDAVAQWIATCCRDHNVWNLTMAQMNQDDNIRGGEGIRLAYDQVYELKRIEQSNGYWMEQMDTRYTPWCEIGTDNHPALVMERTGPYFKDF